MYFADRVDAGRRLGEQLRALAGADAVVLGLPRGGVPVAREVAEALGARLDIVVVRKIGVPFQPELAMGAIAEGGVSIANDPVLRLARVRPEEFAEIDSCERVHLQSQAVCFRGERAPIPLAGRTVIVVDDGIATGTTARAACAAARARGATRVILAVPVGPEGAVCDMRPDADEVVCLYTPPGLMAVGQAYDDFAPVSDQQVVALLGGARGSAAGPGARPPQDAEVIVSAGSARLAGHLVVPPGATGVVVFAHGSGSSRHSPRNRQVAAALNVRGLGTLLLDLLTVDEEADRRNVFDIELLGGRLHEVTGWLHAHPGTRHARIGYLGASTGAAAALWAAADPAADVAAIVSRGGRADLAGPRLALVRAPTLMIVGGRDDRVLDLNRTAMARMRCPTRLDIVPGASHLFEEPGALAAVARLAGEWFTERLVAGIPAVSTGRNDS